MLREDFWFRSTVDLPAGDFSEASPKWIDLCVENDGQLALKLRVYPTVKEKESLRSLFFYKFQRCTTRKQYAPKLIEVGGISKQFTLIWDIATLKIMKLRPPSPCFFFYAHTEVTLRKS